ncbi:immunity 49 family protein [Kitasatospora sp. NPDC088134]|uniref:immunity 49 family protein n=1 Tax=Kitasatospora sp. NPDC088134 TaxID=3364071 RepID=UPI00381A5858
MTTIVERHLVPRPDAEELADRLSGRVARRVDHLETSADLIDLAFSSALSAWWNHCLADPEAGRLETWKATVTALQVGSALFAVTGVEEGTVDCFINGRMRSIPAMGRRTYANADNWLSTLYLAMICRDQERIKRLCEIPLERLRVQEGVYDEFLYTWIDVLQTYWLRRPDLLDKLEVAFAASDPSAPHIAPPEVVDYLLYPPLHLFYLLLRKREDKFGPSLVKALEFHKSYWTSNEAWSSNTSAAVALGPLAVACHAFDGKVPLGVESPYIPKYLLNHEWLGEFPT